MHGWLEGPQWTVREAENGREALKRIQESKPDVILLDLMMPEMDGFAVVAAGFKWAKGKVGDPERWQVVENLLNDARKELFPAIEEQCQEHYRITLFKRYQWLWMPSNVLRSSDKPIASSSLSALAGMIGRIATASMAMQI